MIEDNIYNDISFYYMKMNLEKEGIKNNSFMLQTYDTSLVNFSLNNLINEENIEKKSNIYNIIKKECENNIWFFFKNMVKIPNDIIHSNEYTEYVFHYPYTLTNKLMKIIFLYEHGYSIIIKKGKSPFGATTLLYLLSIYENFINTSDYKSEFYKIHNENYTIINQIVALNHWLYFDLNPGLNKKSIYPISVKSRPSEIIYPKLNNHIYVEIGSDINLMREILLRFVNLKKFLKPDLQIIASIEDSSIIGCETINLSENNTINRVLTEDYFIIRELSNSEIFDNIESIPKYKIIVI